MYKKYLNVVEEKKTELFDLSDYLYDNPETCFEEYKAVEKITGILQANGFQIEYGVGGIPTAFRASFGEGKPHIGVLAEYDALNGLSQVGECPEEKQIEGEVKFHGCGHNLFAGGSVGAVLAIKEYVKEKGEGKVTLFGCPAEEGGAGKVYLAREGVFNGVDAVVSHHPECFYMVRTRPSLALVTVDYSFKGIPAHAGASPDKGRSALDAVELMNVGVNFLREHMPLSARVHYAILDAGGRAPNMVQAHAVVRYVIRDEDGKSVQELKQRVDRIAQGACLMTDTSVEEKVISAYSNLITIPTLQKTANEVMHEVSLPVVTKEDLLYARALQKSLKGADENEPYSMTVLDPKPPVAHGGSTDTADVSWVCPTVQMHIGNWMKGTPAHTWQSGSQCRSNYAKNAMLYASKVVAGTAIRLMENRELLQKAKEEHQEKTLGGYVCPIPPETKPSH